MALRANLKRKEPSFFKRLAKWVLLFIAFIGVLGAAFVLYFNGQNVKAPLLKFLEGRTSFAISCEKVEFSPLYPNVLRLTNLKFNRSKVGEIYVEYDLPSLLSSQTLELREFYARSVDIDKEDLKKISEEKFRFKDISIHKLDLIDCPLYFEILKTSRANFSAGDVLISDDGRLSFQKGSISFEEGNLDGSDVRKFKTAVRFEPEKIMVEDLNMQLFGGTIMCDATIDRESGSINFSRLHLINNIFLNLKDYSRKYRMFAQEASATNCVLSLPKYDLLLGQVSGQIYDLFIGNDSVSLDFEGTAGEISKPRARISADNSDMIVSLESDEARIRLDGNIYNGEYELDATITGLGEESQDLSVRKFELRGAKLEPDRRLYEYVRARLFDMNTHLSLAKIEKTEFVSHIDELPLSVKEISLDARNLKFERISKSIEAENGKVMFSFNQAFYLDLYLKRLESVLSLDENSITLSIPELTLQKSKLSLSTSFDRDLSSFSALVNAKDFDLGELNSSLFPYLFNGKVSLNAQLSTGEDTASAKKETADDALNADETVAVNSDAEDRNLRSGDNAPEDHSLAGRLEGSVKLSSDGILISTLGIDLINGGRKQDYSLSLQEFIEAVKGSDLVLYKLNAGSVIEKGVINTRLSGDLTSSHLTLNSALSLTDGSLLAKATLISLPKDSITLVRAQKDTDDLRFYITALTRGDEIRPGISTEETDRAVMKEKKETEGSTENHPADNAQSPDSVEILEDRHLKLEEQGQDSMSKEQTPPETTVIQD